MVWRCIKGPNSLDKIVKIILKLSQKYLRVALSAVMDVMGRT